MSDPAMRAALEAATRGICRSISEAETCRAPCLLCREGAAAAVRDFLRACPVITDLPPGPDRMGFWDAAARDRWAAAVEEASRDA